MEPNLARFTPRFCPWPECPAHLRAALFTFVRFGSYSRFCQPRSIPRFRCGQCRRTFSAQTFSTTYYLKRPEFQLRLFHRLLTCSGYRQIAREARVHPTSVMGQAARLGRHALLALQHLRPRSSLAEPLVIDGFESFAFSQYHPLHLNLAVGAESHFTYAFTHSELRRKGTMKPRQRRRREWLEREFGRPEPKAIENGIVDLLRIAAPNAPELVVRSDEHPAYPRALRRLGAKVRHERTPSTVARTSDNPLFPVNLMDLLLRHNSANHKRETIAYSKRDQGVVERAAILILWRNWSKQFSERRGGGTPAMRAGFAGGPIPVRTLLRERLFESRVELPKLWREYYRRELNTRRIPSPRRHRLRRAF